MSKRVRRWIALPLGLVPLVAVAAFAIGVSNAAPGSKSLHGHMNDIANFRAGCTSTTGVCSRFTATGTLKGEGVVRVETEPSPIVGSIAFSQAKTVIVTKKGNVECEVEGALFDLAGADHAFVDLCLITGGTGIYDGASGYIQEVGTFDFIANHGEVEYFGKVIYAAD